MSRDLFHQLSWEFSSPAGKAPRRESRTSREDAMGHLEGMRADESEEAGGWAPVHRPNYISTLAQFVPSLHGGLSKERPDLILAKMVPPFLVTGAADSGRDAISPPSPTESHCSQGQPRIGPWSTFPNRLIYLVPNLVEHLDQWPA